MKTGKKHRPTVHTMLQLFKPVVVVDEERKKVLKV